MTFAFGLWLIAAPFILGYGALSTDKLWGPSMSENIVLGMLIAGFSMLTVLDAAVPRALGWFMLAFGGWVMLDPLLYRAWGFTRPETLNDLAAGVAVMLVSLFQLFSVRRNPA
ncbi:MAG TPA: hypothetical protein VNE16_06840 [Vicinamibacterales bacterium]|nr:hypothetical protein [Vicinamibacterales bacterium]